MTVVADSSVLVAIVLGEPDAAMYSRFFKEHEVLVSSVSLMESLMVVDGRQGAEAEQDLRLLLRQSVEQVVSVDAVLADAAYAAWRRFGKGRHPARLNLGDCFSYATAKLAGVPLLFKGDDFAQTDIAAAL